MEDTKKKSAKARTPEQKARRKLARQMALAFWTADSQKANPKADKAAIKAAWGAVRRERTKAALVALRRLEKAGYRFEAPAAPAPQAA